MFLNADGIRGMLLVINIGLILIVGVLIAHVVWVVRLARSPVLARRSGPMRAGVVAAALVTPVIGFYASELLMLWRGHGNGRSAAAIRVLAVVVGLTLLLAAIGAVLVESRYVPGSRNWRHAVRGFTGQAGFLLLAEALLFMVVRVLVAERRAAPWIAFTATAAILVFLVG
jgi:hypothetical protein